MEGSSTDPVGGRGPHPLVPDKDEGSGVGDLREFGPELGDAGDPETLRGRDAVDITDTEGSLVTFDETGGPTVSPRRRPQGDKALKAVVKQINEAIIDSNYDELKALLLDYPDAVNGCEEIHLCPLEVASCLPDAKSRRKFVALLLDCPKVDLSLQDKNGDTIFHRLSYGNVAFALENKSEVNALSFANQLLTHKSQKNKRKELLSIKNMRGSNPIEHAVGFRMKKLAGLFDPSKKPEPSKESERRLSDNFLTTEEEGGGFLYYVTTPEIDSDVESPIETDERALPEQVVNAYKALADVYGEDAGLLEVGEGRGYITSETLKDDGEIIQRFFFLQESDTRFAFVPLLLEDGRTLALMCDWKEKRIELFDPCGPEEASEELERVINTLASRCEKFKRLSGVFTDDLTYSGDYALLYAQHRLENPDLSIDAISQGLELMEDLAVAASEMGGSKVELIARYREKVFGPLLGAQKKKKGKEKT